jgi:hypothetical protein
MRVYPVVGMARFWLFVFEYSSHSPNIRPEGNEVRREDPVIFIISNLLFL